MTDEEDVHEKALVMIASLRAAIKNGVRHFALDGTPLTTELEITNALQRDGRVEFDLTDRVERTTDAVELELARAEFGAARGTAT
jgi:hypothetical protein